MDLACAKALNSMGVFADGAAGFSLGEIPALSCSGLLDMEQAFELVRVRGDAMHWAGTQNKGEMYAVLKLLDTEVEAICNGIDDAWPVNFNFDRQTVVACTEAVGPTLVDKITEAGGDARKLPVSGAFHSPLMAPASAALKSK
ncbi:ACP S-malonyltransferase, partial [bacterium]|nr:ACP S-malonyltransferase [bacterium]